MVKGLGDNAMPKYLASGFDDSVFYLEYGSEKNKFYFEYEYNSLYVVPINTVDSSDKVNEFINTFYGDELINKIGQWGIEGDNFISKTADIIFNTGYKNYYTPKISGWWLENHYMRTATDKEMEYYQFWLDKYWPEVKSNYYNGIYQVIPIEKTIDYNTRNIEECDLHIAFNNLLYKFIAEDMSVEEFLEEYSSEMVRLGGEKYLEDLNSSVRK